METKLLIAVGMFPVALLAYKHYCNGLRCKLAEIALFIYLLSLYWIECMMSSVISFAYYTHFSDSNISRTNTDIYKQQTGISSFHGILCDTQNKSRGKNLIIVPLLCRAII